MTAQRRARLHHLIRIGGAYLAAALAAALAIALLFGGLAPEGFATTANHFGGLVDLALVSLFPWILVTAALPSAAWVAFAEWRRVVHFAYHATAGLVTGAALAVICLPGLAPSDIVLYCLAGTVAGFVYWAIAGRHAGLRSAKAA